MCRTRIFIFIIDFMQNNILLSFIFLISSCTYYPESLGQANEIIVISSPEDRILIEPFLSDLFSHSIHTPQAEYDFILKYRYPWELESYKEYGNIIIASLDFPEDSTADILTQRILDKQNQNAELLTLGDLYAKNQLFCIIHALDAIAFENILTSNYEWILEQYHTLFEKKIMQEVYKYGKK